MCDKTNWYYGEKGNFTSDVRTCCNDCGSNEVPLVGENFTYLGHVLFNGENVHYFLLDRIVRCACGNPIEHVYEFCDELFLEINNAAMVETIIV